MKRAALFPILAAFACLPAPGAEDPAPPERQEPSGGHVFAWPFMDWQEMKPRGGTTKGADVTLMKGAKEAWKRLHEPGLDKFERDRRAILAMAGNYRVSFDFIETLGLAEDFKPARPYFSWGTENVTVLEEGERFISLQHSLVMYFTDEKGETDGPHVMKHWRQDWTREDPELQVYQGDLTWKKTPAPAPEGKWSQAVFQVDDSPRYEVAGTWTHEGGLSVWRSDNCPRPLPRRESTIRKDYNILEGFHEITITPNGWVHVQNNRKLQADKGGGRKYLGQELGVNRYEEITSPDLAAAFKGYWAKTGGYWKSVRETWAEILKQDGFSMKASDQGQQLFMLHFDYAASIEKPDPRADLKHARETVGRFVK